MEAVEQDADVAEAGRLGVAGVADAVAGVEHLAVVLLHRVGDVGTVVDVVADPVAVLVGAGGGVDRPGVDGGVGARVDLGVASDAGAGQRAGAGAEP